MEPLEQLGREVARTLGEGPGPQRRRGQRRAVARLTRLPEGHGAWRRWLAPLAVAAALLCLWLVREGGREAPLTAQVGERPFAAGAWLAATHEPLTLAFSDRSRVVLAPRASARLVHVDAGRVELGLERGRLDLDVAHLPDRTWRVVAGPFTVEVLGTAFSVEWRPEQLTLTVAVTRGSVHVRGGSLPDEGSRLHADQRLEVRDASAPAVAAETDAAPAGPPETPVVGPETPRSRPEPAWRRSLDAGDHAAAIAALERDGLTTQLARLGADDLDRVAHSARLAGAAGPAREALLALRRRFPRDPRARTAAFLLGRVALDLAGEPTEAAAWFSTYLQQQPNGPLAEEARGRLLQLWRDAGDGARARAAAQDYLDHHPDGSRAAQARALIDAP
jgi:TolA-binding protein